MKHSRIFAAAAVLSCAMATVSAQVRRDIAFPDLPGYQTLKCDFHTHTVFSDAYVWPRVRVDEAWREGLDAVAITDHIEYQPHKQDIPTNHGRSQELAAEWALQSNILLPMGAEVTRDTPPGHFNAIFLNDINPLDTEDFYAVFDQAQLQNAFVFWNHPCWKGPERGRWGEEQTTLFEKKQLHGIEICNGDGYCPDAHQYAMERNLTLLGDSDSHHPSPAEPRTATDHRTLTLVFAKERTIDGLREALFAGRTAVWYQNQLIGRESELATLFPLCIKVNAPYHQAKNRVWIALENCCELDIELERVGKDGPEKIKLPARATYLLRMNDSVLEQANGLAYRATNFLIGPDQPLPVTLVIPKQ